MYLSNKNKIKKCVSVSNEAYFKYDPPKKPFFLFQSKLEYRKKIISDRENILLSRLEELMSPSGQISFSSLWYEFGIRDSDDLLLQWIKILSTKPEIAEKNYYRLYKEGGETISKAMESNRINNPRLRVSYKPLTIYVISRLSEIDFWFD
jgi:hypothetical protein